MTNDVKIFAKTIEQEATEQIEKLSHHPVSDGSKVRIMPDVHAGAGCTIGTTMTIHDRICPNLVGVDIGCGMLAVKLGRVDFGIPVKHANAQKIADRFDLALPWHITDDEGRLDLVFTPLIDRVDYMDVKLVTSDQHQVFGTFDGRVVLDDNISFEIHALKGSAEVIHNIY